MNRCLTSSFPNNAIRPCSESRNLQPLSRAKDANAALRRHGVYEQLPISTSASAENPSMPVHLAPEEQFDPDSFIKYTRVIGRAYRCQAMELVTLSRLFLEDLQAPQHDVTCDLLFSVLLQK